MWLAVLFAALFALAALMSRQSPCEQGGHAVKGDVRRDSKGRLLYFDGQCWTTRPAPPLDSPPR